MGFKIIAAGYAVPKRCLSNEDLTTYVETSDAWIQSRTGIKTRYIADDETVTSLAINASKQALKRANIDQNDIGLIICATATAPQAMPSSASVIAKGLSISNQNLMAFDLNAACTGFVYALNVASSLFKQYRYALIIGSETLSDIIDWSDRNTCVLFGDGAGAWIIESQETQVYHYTQYVADIDNVLYTESDHRDNQQRRKLKMQGREVFRFATQTLCLAIEKICDQANIAIHDIDWIVAHQANIRILTYVSKQLSIPLEKFVINLQHYGNTSSASIPIAFCEADQSGQFQANDTILLIGFGAGLSVGATLIHR